MGMSTVGMIGDQMNSPGYGNNQASMEMGRPVGIGQPGQMANNPIYGQQSPFQPQLPNFSDIAGISLGSAGVTGPDGNIQWMEQRPQQQMPMPPGAFDMFPVLRADQLPAQQPLQGGSFGKSMPPGAFDMFPVLRADQLPGQQPLQGTPMMPNQQASQEIGRPVGIGQPGQQPFSGGLRPAPKGYRPPLRPGGIMRRRIGR